MLIVNKDSVNVTRQKLEDPRKLLEVINEVKKMLEIKEALLWRAEGMSSCCGSLANISACLTREVNILQNTLSALENGNTAQATDLLQEYLNVMEASGEPSQPNYC